jgi:co-chaperonin GroES (HSP10)
MTESLIQKELNTDIDVQGYRILLRAVILPEATKSGIILTETYKKLERRAYNVGLVLKMGEMAYKPLEKFGGKPYCEVGDWVFYSSYEREEAYINDQLCFFINDERVYAKIPDITAVIKELR